MPKDYYATLGVQKNATADELKKAFRTLAHKYHPDKPGGDAEKFKEVNEAYQVLGDPEKRSRYDQFGSAAFDGSAGGNPFGGGFGAGGPFGGGGGGFDFSGFQGGNMEDLGDILGGMFGFGGGRGRGTSRGHDVQVDVDLSFREAVFGVEREITLTKPSSCARCGGVGAEPGTKMKTCGTCNGSGAVVRTQRTILGSFQAKTVCGDCDGEGEIPETKCAECSGSGVSRRKVTVEVRIPPGTDDGVVYRLRGEGEAVRGGQAGDLLVRVHVEPDPRFVREDATIHSSARIGFTQAALGATIDVETLDGPVELNVPAGTQGGAQFRLRGKGVPAGRSGGRGDQVVTVEVVTPTKLSREQRALLEQLDLREE